MGMGRRRRRRGNAAFRGMISEVALSADKAADSRAAFVKQLIDPAGRIRR